MSKACGTVLARSEYSFSSPSLPGTQKSQMTEHCSLNSRAYLRIVAVAPQLYSIITSTKENRKLLVATTMESRCRTCPVIRKILQSWHSVRTQRERAEPMTEGRLCSLECAPNCQPQKGSLALRLRCLCGVGHSLCSSRQVASEHMTFSSHR